MEGSVAHAVLGLGVGPGLQQEGHDVGELGGLGNRLGQQGRAA